MAVVCRQFAKLFVEMFYFETVKKYETFAAILICMAYKP
jgi:hypothetical protein